ncbi:LysR family transcriptional regulator [Komagataeibacter medellinensis]|uniref:Transcriptional regulator LysR family n=1 Tax=Komagataeibacter medellinensis (strain NBRC 3288 / BCRC 11682 / LMG 1693 / Kondo 51) TaxID=634177 RepID=G2I379_KOMMN|nr:LysR substrate-binding domain-containing protein [Komagataeibacter medellinensis]BAK82684.1 transcriptional regulator LysR family [Komagataeibacter medellinensis NBRC 3288]
MFLRQLTYLIALDHYRHFSRAAESCGVSQPALSAAIRQLESELGITIIRRTRRFNGLTDEGRRVLDWARQTLAALDGLRQEAAFAQQVAGGTLSIGVMPPSLQAMPLLMESFRTAIPGLHLQVRLGSSTDTIHGLRQQQLDLGLVYLDQIPPDGPFETRSLYTEQHVLVAAEPLELPAGRQDWSCLADLPLCLLSPEMRTRQIVDAAFGQAGVTPTIMLETNSLEILYGEVLGGRLASILPVAALPTHTGRNRLQIRPLGACAVPEVGLVRLAPTQPTTLATRVWEIAATLEMRDVFAIG